MGIVGRVATLQFFDESISGRVIPKLVTAKAAIALLIVKLLLRSIFTMILVNHWLSRARPSPNVARMTFRLAVSIRSHNLGVKSRSASYLRMRLLVLRGE